MQPAQYQVTPKALTDGQMAPLLVDSKGRLMLGAEITVGSIDIGAVEIKDSASGNLASVSAAGAISISEATKLAGEDLTNDVLKVEERFSFATIATAATTVVKTGAGYLNAITVTGGTAGTIIIYDNTAGSGTVIATFGSTNALFTYQFDVLFATGLTIVTSAATNITVSFR